MTETVSGLEPQTTEAQRIRPLTRQVPVVRQAEEGEQMISTERRDERNGFIQRCIDRGMRLSPDNRVITPMGHRNPVRPTTRRSGYWKTTLTLDGVTEVFTTARIVCWLAHGPPPPNGVVDHIDGNSRNDHPRNLRWVTQGENCANVAPEVAARRVAHAKAIGGAKALRGYGLDEVEIEQMKGLAGTATQAVIAARFGVSPATVSRIVSGPPKAPGRPRPRLVELTWQEAVDFAAGLEADGYRPVDFGGVVRLPPGVTPDDGDDGEPPRAA